jgi:hypothetical protein
MTERTMFNRLSLCIVVKEGRGSLSRGRKHTGKDMSQESMSRKRNKKGKSPLRVVFCQMSDEAVCLERKLVVPDANVDEVSLACQKAFKEMGLKVMKTERTKEGSTIVLAGEGALVPLTLRTLLSPFSIQQYVKAAQRSGVHVVISPSQEGTIIYSCGLALDEITGKPAKSLSQEDMDDISNTLEALDFESKFIKEIKELFPETREIE